MIQSDLVNVKITKLSMNEESENEESDSDNYKSSSSSYAVSCCASECDCRDCDDWYTDRGKHYYKYGYESVWRHAPYILHYAPDFMHDRYNTLINAYKTNVLINGCHKETLQQKVITKTLKKQLGKGRFNYLTLGYKLGSCDFCCDNEFVYNMDMSSKNNSFDVCVKCMIELQPILDEPKKYLAEYEALKEAKKQPGYISDSRQVKKIKINPQYTKDSPELPVYINDILYTIINGYPRLQYEDTKFNCDMCNESTKLLVLFKIQTTNNNSDVKKRKRSKYVETDICVKCIYRLHLLTLEYFIKSWVENSVGLSQAQKDFDRLSWY